MRVHQIWWMVTRGDITTKASGVPSSVALSSTTSPLTTALHFLDCTPLHLFWEKKPTHYICTCPTSSKTWRLTGRWISAADQLHAGHDAPEEHKSAFQPFQKNQEKGKGERKEGEKSRPGRKIRLALLKHLWIRPAQATASQQITALSHNSSNTLVPPPLFAVCQIRFPLIGYHFFLFLPIITNYSVVKVASCLVMSLSGNRASLSRIWM